MPSPDLALTVPRPCHRDWEQMTPADQGRHCAACAKVVVDFTRKTDAELLTWFSTPPPEATCGHFRPDQLDRLQPRATPQPPVPAPTPRWQAWLAAADAEAARYAPLIPKHFLAPQG